MSQWSNVHLMFCEGPHDAAFLNRLLKKQLGFEKVELKLSELPYPISNVLLQSVRKRAADDLRLDLAKKFFLPDYLVASNGTLVMIFNYGGSKRQASMTPFLEDVFTLLAATKFADPGEIASTAFSVSDETDSSTEFAYIVFTDADSIGTVKARAQIHADLSIIGESEWFKDEWTEFEGTRAVKQHTVFGATATYVWKKWEEDNGTLEDIVFDCLLEDEGLQQTLKFLDARFNWTPAAGATSKQICATAAKRLKAAFCVEGQREKPGMSLGVVLDQTELLSAEAVEKSAAVQDCLNFLRNWLTPAPCVAAKLINTANLVELPQ